MLGQDRPEKIQPNAYFEAARFRVLEDINRRNQRLRHENLNGARSLGAPTHPLVSVHKTAGDTWRAPARRLIQKHLVAGV